MGGDTEQLNCIRCDKTLSYIDRFMGRKMCGRCKKVIRTLKDQHNAVQAREVARTIEDEFKYELERRR